MPKQPTRLAGRWEQRQETAAFDPAQEWESAIIDLMHPDAYQLYRTAPVYKLRRSPLLGA